MSLSALSAGNRLVVKIGSALLVDALGQLRTDWVSALAADIAELSQQSIEVVLVSSGAIALGRNRLKLTDKPLTLAQKQACAAAGQSQLTQAYEAALVPFGLVTAQALLTLEDTEDRRRWLNARSTLETLLGLGAIPIINENDTVATDEIRYGDNDRLAARTAQMLGANQLVLLSDIDGLYSADPRRDASAKHLPIVTEITPDILAMGGSANASSGVGTGGMATKLAAAQIAVGAGCEMIICDGRQPGALGALAAGATHTRFCAHDNPRNARAQWILGALKPRGELHIDTGAAKALRAGNSLLAAGVTACDGQFAKGDAVRVMSNDTEIARGLISYDAKDAIKILGRSSDDISKYLGYDNGAALIHRDNLVML